VPFEPAGFRVAVQQGSLRKRAANRPAVAQQRTSCLYFVLLLRHDPLTGNAEPGHHPDMVATGFHLLIVGDAGSLNQDFKRFPSLPIFSKRVTTSRCAVQSDR
jgi:hypothetical protein